MMSDVYLTKNEIKGLKPLKDGFDGSYGRCYKYKEGVLKLFYNWYEIPRRNVSKNLKRNSYVVKYPKKKVYIVDDFAPSYLGYTCDMAPGFSLKTLEDKLINKKLDISFDDFLTAFYDKFLSELKKEDVIMNDVALRHIFLDDCFYLIDTDLYEKRPRSTSEIGKNKHNMCLINNAINVFIRDTVTDEIDFVCSSYVDSYVYDEIENIRRITCEDTFNKARTYFKRK